MSFDLSLRDGYLEALRAIQAMHVDCHFCEHCMCNTLPSCSHYPYFARLVVYYNDLDPRGTHVKVEPASNTPLNRANQITSTII